MTAVGLLAILALAVLPLAIMAWRFARGDEVVTGAAPGRQIARGERDDPFA